MSYRVEKVRNRIYLKSSLPTPGLKSSVPGAYFSDTKKAWTFPLNLETCQILRERFGQQLKIGPQLWDWAAAEKATREERASLAVQADAILHWVPKLAPKLAKAMESRTYQRVAARYIADAKTALVGDTVGLGKTIEALAGVVESGVSGPYLVVCPKTAVESVWHPEIKRWLEGPEVVTVPDGRAKRDRILNALAERAPADLASTWVVIHPAAVRTKSWWICDECGSETQKKAGPKELICDHDARNSTTRHDHEYPQLFDFNWGAIIADESDQSIIRLKGTPNQTRNGMELLRDLAQGPDALRIAMSGTPFRSRPHLLWSTLNWLRPKDFTSFWNWAKLYWELGGYSGWELGRFREERESMLWDSLKPVMIRRTREEVRGDLPERNYLDNGGLEGIPGIWLPMEPAQEKAYNEMRDMAAANIEGGTLQAVGILAELTRLKQFAVAYGSLEYGRRQISGWEEATKRQMAARRGRDLGRDPLTEAAMAFRPAAPSNKYNYCLQLLRELGFPDDPQTKVVIVSQFTSVLEAFQSWFEKDLGTAKCPLEVVSITGKVTATKRTEAIARFEDTKSRTALMLLNVKAGGSAITLDAANEMIFLDETWIPDDQEQAEGRIDNRNPERKIVQRNYRYLRSLGTIETSIAEDNAQKKARSNRLLDGRRDRQFAQRLLEREKALRG